MNIPGRVKIMYNPITGRLAAEDADTGKQVETASIVLSSTPGGIGAEITFLWHASESQRMQSFTLTYEALAMDLDIHTPLLGHEWQ